MFSEIFIKCSVSQGTLSINLVGLQNHQNQVNSILQKVFPNSPMNAPALKEISPHLVQQINNVTSYLNKANANCMRNNLISLIKIAAMTACLAGLIIGFSSASTPLILVSMIAYLAISIISNRVSHHNSDPTNQFLTDIPFKKVLFNNTLALEGYARIWRGTEAGCLLNEQLVKSLRQAQENKHNMQAVHDFYQEHLPRTIEKLEGRLVGLQNLKDDQGFLPNQLTEEKQRLEEELTTLKAFQKTLTPSPKA